MGITRRVGVLAILGLALLTFGCAGSETANPGQDLGVDTVPSDSNPLDRTYKLTIVGWQNLKLQQGQQVVLQVRLTKNEESAANEAISFAFKGDAGNSTLSSMTSITDSQGFAETTLMAGQVLTKFKVEASALKAAAVFWDVEVVKKPDQPPAAGQLAGTFSLESKFDIQTQFTGSQLAVVIDYLDAIADPGKFIIDWIYDQLDSGYQTILNPFRPALYVEVKKLIDANSPQFLLDLQSIADDLRSLARRFEIKSRMISVTPQPGDKPMSVTHRLDTITWTLKGAPHEYTFAQLGMPDPEVAALSLTLANAVDLTIAEHSFDLKFGAFLVVLLNEMIIPMIKASANSIADLMLSWVDCQKVGEKIDQTIGIGGTSFWKAACETGMKAIGTFLEGEILKIDQDSSTLTIKGQCKLTDDNADGFYDSMTYGLWTGNFKLNQASAPVVGAGNSFTGKRTK